ncbi:hypothetical protein, partial [uncultured Desulfovibrio sp.]|uniref:hypothetical protein n=1 Tax=uncultured Desulfovibrio sp. TaxID=167968 RepID=UPI00260B5B1D
MPSFQEIIAFCPPSLVILIGMGLQLPALLLRCRLLLVCGALVWQIVPRKLTKGLSKKKAP